MDKDLKHTGTHTHTHNGMLATEKNEITSSLAIWMDLEIITLTQTKTNII